jgi:hypothetical protein
VQRAFLEPVEAVAQANDATDDADRRWFEAGLLDAAGDGSEGSGEVC